MSSRGSIDVSRVISWAVVIVIAIVVLAAIWDGDDPTPPSTSDGTTTTEPAPPAAQPDFVISGVSVQPAGPVVPPGSVQISATVTNIGSADYGHWIVVSAPGNHSGGVDGLAAGASDVAVIDFPVPSPNVTVTLSLVVDPDNVTAEESEANNVSQTISITTSS